MYRSKVINPILIIDNSRGFMDCTQPHSPTTQHISEGTVCKPSTGYDITQEFRLLSQIAWENLFTTLMVIWVTQRGYLTNAHVSRNDPLVHNIFNYKKMYGRILIGYILHWCYFDHQMAPSMDVTDITKLTFVVVTQQGVVKWPQADRSCVVTYPVSTFGRIHAKIS